MAWAAQRGCVVSSLEIFKSHLDAMLGNLLWVSQFEQGVGPDDLQQSLSAVTVL